MTTHRHAAAPGVALRFVGEDVFCLWEPAGRLRVFDRANGAERWSHALEPADEPVGALPHLLLDHDTVYVALETPRDEGPFRWLDPRSFGPFTAEQPAVRVHGSLHAFDRATGKPRWRRRGLDGFLALPRDTEGPVLCLAGHHPAENAGAGVVTRIALIDRATGATLVDQQRSGRIIWRTIVADHRSRAVELRAWNETWRFEFLTAAEAKQTPAANPSVFERTVRRLKEPP